jgi:hypothetical protein
MRIQEDPANAFKLVNAITACDLFLFTRTWNNLVTMEHLALMKRLGVPSASYHLDLYVGLKREDGLDNDPFWRTEYVFSPDGDPKSAEVFKRKGINHFYMRPGVYKKECYLAKPGYEPQGNDVIFVGGGMEYGHPEWPYRQELVKWLAATYGHRYSKYGWPQATVRNAELNNLYANSKIAIGDSVCIGFNHENYWSDRIFETTGRGGFMIHPYIKGLEECFVSGQEVVFYEYGDFKMLKDLIDYHLRHDEQREKIRLAGHERTLRDHTYNNRLAQMIETIQAAK